jgi:hypothetical protein
VIDDLSSSPLDSSKKAFLVMKTQVQYPRFLREEAKKIAQDVILKPLHSRMKSFGYSQKIIDGTTIENLNIRRNGTMSFDVVSDYESESGFDVASAREKGTRSHFIKPVNAKALSFIVGGFIRGFSKGHWVRGITPTNVVKKTVQEKIPEAQARLNEATDRFIARSMKE